MTPEQRLKKIAEIIEFVDGRCMVADGDVPSTLNEMTQSEISEIYQLAKLDNDKIKKLYIQFYSNGITTAFDKNGKQQPELQYPWFELYSEFLSSKGIDPTHHEYTMPNGVQAEVFKAGDRYSWRLKTMEAPTLI